MPITIAWQQQEDAEISRAEEKIEQYYWEK